MRIKTATETEDPNPNSGPGTRIKTATEAKDPNQNSGPGTRIKTATEAKDPNPNSGPGMRIKTATEAKDRNLNSGAGTRMQAAAEANSIPGSRMVLTLYDVEMQPCRCIELSTEQLNSTTKRTYCSRKGDYEVSVFHNIGRGDCFFYALFPNDSVTSARRNYCNFLR